VEGDTVEIRDNKIILSGKTISREIAPEAYEEELDGRRYNVQWNGATPDSRKMPVVTVPPGNVFVLGDNRAKGQDRRGYGFLPLSSIKGRAAWIWFSTGATSEALGVRWSRLLTRVN